jgi:hypothetical protein
MDYQIGSIDYEHNYETLFGLYRTMDIKDIFDYFQDPEKNGFERLLEPYMIKTKTIGKNGKSGDITLKDISKKSKDKIEKDIKCFEKLQEAGKILSYGGIKFIVDIEEKQENQLQHGPQTAGYYEY